MKEVAFLADESEKISDSRKRCYPIRESESDSSNYKNMGTSKKVYVWYQVMLLLHWFFMKSY